MGALDRMKSGIRPEQNTARTEQTPARGSALERMKAGGAPQRKEPVQVTAPAPVEQEADTGMSWDKRLANILAGSAKQSAGGWASGVSTLYEAGQKARDTQSQVFVAEQQENLERAKRELAFMLEDNEKAPGAWSQADIDSSRNIIADAERKLAAMGVVTDGQVQQKAATTARDYSAKVMDSGAKDVEEAKKGLGAVGQFLVDAGVAGSQLAGDAAVGLATGGGALLPMALRTFGSGAEDAREAGAELDKQLLYGAGSAAIGVAAEKIANVAKPFSKVFGKGVLDNAIAKATGKLGQTAAGKIALSALSEGGEEFVEALLQPVLQRATYDQNARFDLSDALYQAAIGAALGGGGGGVDVVTSRKGGETPQNTPPNAAAQRTAQSESVDTARSESPAEAPTDPLVRAMFGQEKTAPEVGTAGNTRLTEADLDDYMRVGERQHVRNQKQEILGKGTSPILTKAAEVVDFIKRSFSGEIRDEIRAYGKVGSVFADRVRNATDGKVDIDGYYLELDSNKIAHLGDHVETDKDPRSIPLTREQLEQLPEYIDTFDDLIDVIRRKDGSVRLMLGKKINGHSIIVETVSKGRRALHPVTAYQVDSEHYEQNYKTKAVDRSSTPQPANADQMDISRQATTLAGDSIPENAAAVKPGTVGAAAAGFQTPGSQSVERTSNLAEHTTPYTGREGEATARTRQEYDELFRYRSQTEEQSMQEAQNMLYLLVDGQETFLMDFDPEGYQAITDSLRLAPAWSGIMTDAAMLIRKELKGRSIDGTVSEDTYAEWLQTMREHATAGGQGTQAWAKWSRRDNDAGQSTEAEAWENLENSNLSEEERRERFRAIVLFDSRIEAAQTDADLKDIILEIARERGTLSGLTGKQSNLLTGVASKALDTLTHDQLKQFAYSSSAALSTDAAGANMGQKAKTIQILNMLSNPKTPAKNLAGNTSFYALDAMSMRGAALLDMALSRITGTRSVAMEGSVLGKESRDAIARAIQMSLAEVTMDVDMGGNNRYQQGVHRTFKAGGTGVLNTNRAADRFAERVLSALERNMGYLMTTTDEAYKGAARATAGATQRLVDEGRIKNAGRDYARNQADNLAVYRTFQNHGKLATAIQTVHDVLNIIGFGDSGRTLGRGDSAVTIHSFGLGDLVAPFTRVAGNLAAVGLDYSPVNAVKGTVEILDTVRRAAGGSADPARQAKAVSDFARGMSGSAIAYGVMVLAKAGIIKRADDEDDEDVAALNQSEGLTGTQVNIDAAQRWLNGGSQKWQPGDTLIDMSNLEPLNFILSLGVEMGDNGADGFLSTFTDADTYKDTVGSAVATAGDLPILSSVGDFATDVLVYHNDPVEAGAEMLGKTAISSVTPNILAAFAKGWDSKQRSTYSGDGVEDVLLDTVKSRIPGLREQLPTTVNTLGEEKDNPGNLAARLVNAMLNPIGVNQYSQNEVSMEMERVREETGETGFYPTTRKPDKLAWKDKEGQTHEVTLDYAQQQKFQATCSAVQMSAAADMIGSGLYQQAAAGEQAALLQRCYDYAYQYAKAGVLGEKAVDTWVVNARNARQDLGISTTDFLCYYEKYGSGVMGGSGYNTTKRMVGAGLTVDQWATMKNKVDADGSGSVKKAEVTAYIEANFPKEKWSGLFDAYKGGSNWKNPY